MSTHAVTYRGDMVAIAGPERFWLVGPWLDGRGHGDPTARFVTFMCLYNREVEAGRVPRPFTSEAAELWARLALVDDDLLVACSASTDTALARAMNVPEEQVSKRRMELGLERSPRPSSGNC